MKVIHYVSLGLIIFLLSLLTSRCGHKSEETNQQAARTQPKRKYNPVVYFEIPVTNIERAVYFYTSVFNVTFQRQVIDKNEMALFPFTNENTGISGALAKGEIYKPTKDGAVLYFATDNIDSTLKLALANGGHLLYPKTSNGDLGFVAEFEDSEGNRIALHQAIE